MKGTIAPADYHALRSTPEKWLPLVVDIARRSGLPSAEPQVFGTDTNLVIGLGDTILKVFPAFTRGQFEAERLALPMLAGRLSVDTPALLAAGEREGWSWLAMSRLAGEPGEKIVPSLGEDERLRLMWRIGQVIAEVQRVPCEPLIARSTPWPEFLAAQIAGCRARHERLGLPAHLLAGLEAYLAATTPLLPAQVTQVMLTGEYIPENFMMSRRADGWHLSGLFDFGDSMAGFGEYDLLGPCVFIAAGISSRVRALLGGYGYDAPDRDLPRRLGALMLLHRYSDLNRQIAIDDWPAKAVTLCGLERLVWPL